MQCKEGAVIVSLDDFTNLRQGSTEAGCMRSPSKVCKLGHTQDFKILSKKEYIKDEGEESTEPGSGIDQEQQAIDVAKFSQLEEDHDLLKKRVLTLEQSVNELHKKKKASKKRGTE